MRRALSLSLLAGGLIVFAVAALGSGSGRTYRVRAIFDNAFSVIAGEDVKIAGVRVGRIESLDVTPDQKAAVVLSISRPGFGDFRADATCTIRPQSLIGEKFVECVPTQPRSPGVGAPAPLRRVPRGQPGEGEYLLPSSQTSRPVDLDLLNNVLRLPPRQRLSIVLNELGTGLAGRGQDLREVIRKADPALAQTDRVLHILAGQNRVLAALARNSDAVARPLARQRARIADFVASADTTARATALRGAGLQADVARLPAFLGQLRPTMVRLGALSDAMTPVLGDLGHQAPAISRVVSELGPFSRAATPALRSLGSAADVGRPALIAAQPVLGNLQSFARTARPLSVNLAALTASLHDTGGVQRLMDYLFYQVAAINGYDAFGHYLRAALLINLCSTYTVAATDPNCSANFKKAAPTTGAQKGATASVAAGGRSPFLSRQDAILRQAGSRGALNPRPPRRSAPARPQRRPQSAPRARSGSPAPGSASALFDYLFGSR